MGVIDFAFLGHPASFDHVRTLLPHIRPGLDTTHANPAMLAKVFEWSEPFAAEELLLMTAANGTVACGKLIFCPFLPEHAHSPRQLAMAYQKTRAGAQLARDLGAKIIGLGGFTSIVGGVQEEKLPKELGLAATSGNSLTAALALVQLATLLEQLHLNPARQTAAVLGATGDIGKACALGLIQQLGLKRLLLVARNRAKLESWRQELLNLAPDIELRISLNPSEALQTSLIVAATSASTPLLAEVDLLPGTILCDIGYPETLAYAPTPRSDVLAFRGGLARSNTPLPIRAYTLLPSAHLLHGCFAETLALALAGRYESFSLGQGHITLERMQSILELARSQGFQPAPLYHGSHFITTTDLENFLRQAPQRI